MHPSTLIAQAGLGGHQFTRAAEEMARPAQAPRDKAPLEVAVDRLNGAVDRLGMALDALQDRLGTVLRPVPLEVANKGNASGAVECRSVAVECIESAMQRVQRLADQIEAVRDRLDT